MLENLKKLRKLHGISQQKLAEAVLVSQQSINKYENHDVQPDIEILKRIADYFGTSIDYVVGYTEYPNKVEPLTDLSLNKNENKLISQYRLLNKKQRDSISMIIENYNHDK